MERDVTENMILHQVGPAVGSIDKNKTALRVHTQHCLFKIKLQKVWPGPLLHISVCGIYIVL